MQSLLSSALQMTPFSAVSVPSIPMVIYAVVYLFVALAVAINTFQHRDI